jgi:3-isopropylmalate/(R)-2-methylmalate dehydratase small subunit
MKKIIHISGLAIPLNRRDVDTDLIIPAQYLTQVTKEGYGQALFRRLKDSDPDFVFNQARYHSAKILIAGDNFGCGSSREHAVWALMEAGIKVIISSSFSDIFYSNSAKNDLVLIIQPEKIVKKMMANAEKEHYVLTVDIENQTIKSSLDEDFHFQIEAFRKHCFLHGLVQLDYILSHSNEIEQFDNKQKEMPYSNVFNPIDAIR